jgi:hypothetical protein
VLKVHLSDGQTLEVKITGLTVIKRGVQYSLPRPRSFQESTLSAESFKAGKGGQRVFCFSDDVRLSMTVHNSLRAVRVQLSKLGRRKFNPESP